MRFMTVSRFILNPLLWITIVFVLWYSHQANIVVIVRNETATSETYVHFCKREAQQECVKPFISFKQRFRVAGQYKMIGCAIDKNFSTLLTAVLCFLHNETRFLKSGRKFVNEIFQRRFCGSRNEYNKLEEISNKFKIKSQTLWKDWLLLAIVRDPIKRFVSGFTDKCIIEQTWKKYPDRCNGCKQNMTCFLERQYKRMMKKSNKEKIFANFDDDHFHPQNWRCEFQSNFDKYQIISYDSENSEPFLEEFYDILKKRKVPPNSLDFIRTSISTNRTKHSTVNLPERLEVARAVHEKYHMELLIKMYYYDFVIFGYDVPNL